MYYSFQCNKRKRVLKRARFRFLPALRAKEAEKFDGKESLGYPGKKEMAQIKKRVDSQKARAKSYYLYASRHCPC